MSHSTELATAIAAAKAGEEIALKHFANLAGAGIENKIAGQEYRGIVTQADVESEQAIVATIADVFPDHSFLAEEEHTAPQDADHLWIIDPIDGTNNFAHGIPHFAVSVAYYQNGNPICGVVLNPSTGDTFTAEQGGGAWFNGKRVGVNQHQTLDQTIVAVGFYYDRGSMMQATLKTIEELFTHNIHGIRRFGTAALDLVQVGLGRFGAFFEYQLSPWDFAAARLFVEQAGGKITTCTGDPIPLAKTSILATNAHLHPVMLEVVGRRASF